MISIMRIVFFSLKLNIMSKSQNIFSKIGKVLTILLQILGVLKDNHKKD